jgi:hypothetical protein
MGVEYSTYVTYFKPEESVIINLSVFMGIKVTQPFEKMLSVKHIIIIHI